MSETQYLLRCFQLAKNGLGNTAPNPLVGCVIVHNNKIIGEGYHRQYGAAHAEVNAINSVQDKSLLKESTLYVNLEPCSHYGKTPPCADLIIKHKLKKVVISNIDPFAAVAGRGVERLKKAGIQVETGVLENEGAILNKRFFTFHNKQRPYIILKWAQSLNGFLDYKTEKTEIVSIPISSNLSRQMVHQWRAEEAGILVGSNTVKNDNPSLTVRLAGGKNPTRIIIDPNLEANNNNALIYNNQAPTLIYNYLKSGSTDNIDWIKLAPDNFVIDLLKSLHEQNVQSVLVEGGAITLNTFIQQNLWDEARIFTSNYPINGKTKAPLFNVESTLTKKVDNDILNIYFNQNR